MDAFFPSVEQKDQAFFRGKLLIVTGIPQKTEVLLPFFPSKREVRYSFRGGIVLL